THSFALADDLMNIAQVLVVTSLDTADQCIGFAAAYRESADHRRIGAHDGAGRLRIDAGAPDKGEVVIDIIAVTGIVLGIDDLEIDVRPEPDTEALQPRLDDAGAADEDGAGGLVFQQHLGRAQHAFVLALGE